MAKTKINVGAAITRLEDVSSELEGVIGMLCGKSVRLDDDQLEAVITVLDDMDGMRLQLFTKWRELMSGKRSVVVSRDGKTAQKLTAGGKLTGGKIKRTAKRASA